MFCTTYCPTQYTLSGGDTCAPSGTAPETVYKSTFDEFGTVFSDNSIDATATGTYPAYKRGQYFDSAGPDYMTFGTFALNL
jgi:hypothetical protein